MTLLTTEQLLEQVPGVFNQGRLIDDQYAKNLDDYPDLSLISKHIEENGFPSKHIYTKDINVNGRAVHDSFEKYLGASNYYSSGNFAKASMETEIDLLYDVEEGDKDELEEFRNRKPFVLGTFIHEAILEPTKWKRVTVKPSLFDGEVLAANSKTGVEATLKWFDHIIKESFDSDDQIREVYKAVGDACGIHSPVQFKEKQKYIKALEAHCGIAIVDEKNKLIIDIIKKRWDNYSNGFLKKIIKHSKREISFYAEDYLGLPHRVRPDALLFEENIGINAVLSIKSTSKPSLRLFMNQVVQHQYHVKEACYQEVVSHVTGRDFSTTIFIMCQTVAPFNVAAIRLNPVAIELGKSLYRRGIDVLQNCLDSGVYRGHDAFAEIGHCGIVDMDLPKFAYVSPLPVEFAT